MFFYQLCTHTVLWPLPYSVQLSSGDDWSTDSSGTDYEPVGEDNLYEDPDTFDSVDGKKKKKDGKEESPSGQSLGNKLKKNVDKATTYLNKITKFNKKKSPKVVG